MTELDDMTTGPSGAQPSAEQDQYGERLLKMSPDELSKAADALAALMGSGSQTPEPDNSSATSRYETTGLFERIKQGRPGLTNAEISAELEAHGF